MRLTRRMLAGMLTALGLLATFAPGAWSAGQAGTRAAEQAVDSAVRKLSSTRHPPSPSTRHAGSVAASAPGFVDRLEIVSRETAFGGQSFGRHGSYERIVAVAHYKIDPRHPANQGIADLALTLPGPDGLIDYRSDVVILRPADAQQARRLLLLEIPNRGIPLLPWRANNTPMTSAAQFTISGNGFLMRQGYTLVWSGWQADLTAPDAIKASFPTPTEQGAAITGFVQLETVFDHNAQTGTIALTYPVADPANVQAELTVRATPTDAPHIVPRGQWRMTDVRTVEVRRPEGYDAGAIYRLVYLARDPWVSGLAFSGVRDLVRFLRNEAVDAQGNPNPLADLRAAPCERNGQTGRCIAPDANVDVAMAIGSSQSGRFLRDWLWQGFNDDGNSSRVFDGVLAIVPGSRKASINHRWAQPSRFSRQHEEHLVYGNQFPFAYATTVDPLTGNADGILRRCQSSATCPKLFHLDTSAEFWQAGASLIGNDGLGHEIALPPNVRAYMVAGGTHAPGMNSPACALPANPLNYDSLLRALLVAMDDWIAERATPPASRWPSTAQGTLLPLPQARAGFPDLRALNAEMPGVINTVPRVDYAAVPPAVVDARGWPVLVPATDPDGNDLAGIRPPPVAVPRGTYLGWNIRKPGYAPGQLCFIFGTHLPFEANAAANASSRASGDPRAPLDARYANDNDYLARLRAASESLHADRLILAEDVQRYVDEAERTLDTRATAR